MKIEGVPIISKEDGHYLVNGQKMTQEELRQLFADIKKREEVRLKAKKST
jgi:biopolymer transport protein ExbD